MIEFKFDDGGREAAGYTGFTDDCVVRAIAIATGKQYADVYSELHKAALNNRAYMASLELRYGKHAPRHASPRTGVSKSIYIPYLEENGFKWVPAKLVGQKKTMHLRTDEVPGGRVIVRLSKHLAAVINKVLHDNHDCSRNGKRMVYGYWRLP